MAKNYVRDTSGLKRYHDAMRKAKEIGGAYGEYVKQYYRVSRGLRKRGVKIKYTGARVLTYEEYLIDINSEGISTSKLVAEQFGLLSGNEARKLQAALASRGFDISLQRAMTRQLSPTEWRMIDLEYADLRRKGLSSQAAGLEISNYFFGS